MRSLIPFSWMGQPSRGGENDPFNTLRKEIDRLFDDAGRWPFGAVAAFGGAEPRLAVSETETAVEVEAELPGMDEKDVEVALRDDVLTIKGEKKQEREEKKKDYHLMERSYGSFARSVRLPFDADPGSVKAAFEKGVLKVTIPKPAGVTDKTVKIPVKSGS